MNKELFKKLSNFLVDILENRSRWRVGEITNDIANFYYSEHFMDVNKIYSNHSSIETIFVLNDGRALLFYDENGSVFEYKHNEGLESLLFYYIVKAIEKEEKHSEEIVALVERMEHLEYMEEAYNAVCDGTYYEKLKYIEALENKLERKTKAYNNLKEQYELLLDKLEV